MRIPLDRRSGTPLYRQIEGWLRAAILDGGLSDATRLPSSRALASELGVSRITVANAYVELEADGLIITREGSGTFVAAPLPTSVADSDDDGREWPLWQRELPSAPVSPATRGPGDAPHPDRISFTGVGDPRLFPLREFARTITEVLRQDGIVALEYGPFDRGHPPLLDTVARVLTSQGIHARPEQVLITAGSQQAIALACQVLLAPGDSVIVEQPTYNFAVDLFRNLRLKVVGVPVDASGMRVELVESLLQQHHPRLVYTVPNFQNPTGTCLSTPRRRHLLELCSRYNVPILEDDFAGDLRFEGRAQPAIKALDHTGQVIYAGTFSKLLMPGLRLGYLLADGPVLDQLALHKRVHDLTTSPLMQRVVHRYVTIGRYQSHLRRTIRVCRARRDTMLAALREHLPDATVTPPHGGLFVWLELPAPASARMLLTFAGKSGVDFAPGDLFFADPADGDRFLRLNFATHTADDIIRGIERLAVALHHAQDDAATAASTAPP
jgi:GntR family transcriptional regulator / MocR family aminotransferase